MTRHVLVRIVVWGVFALYPKIGLTAQDQRAFLDLTVNLAAKGEVLVVLRMGDVLVRVADLEQAGLRSFVGQRETVMDETYVSLASLAPAITYVLDEQALVLRLTADPTLFVPTVLTLRPGQPPQIAYIGDTSAFLNYAINGRDLKHSDALVEVGMSFEGHLLNSTFALNPDGSFSRGLTNFTVDQRDQLRRWVIGDHFAGAGGLGGSLLLGGLSISREFSLDPYFIRHPTLGFSGTLLTPSTVDISVDGRLLRQERLPPGPFELRDLLLLSGSGSLRLVIRDAFGREQEIAYPYYASTGILAQGLSEYSYNLGFRRKDLNTVQGDYGSPAFLGVHRLGLTDALTAGMRLEVAPGLLSGGPTVTARLPFGEVELSVAASQENSLRGSAASLAYTYLGRPVSFNAFVRVLSARYATVSLTSVDDRARLETSASISLPLLSRLSLSLGYAFVDFRDRGRTERFSILSNTRLTERANLFVSARYTRERGSQDVTDVLIGLSYSFGGNTTGTLIQQQRDGVSTSLASIQKALPVGSGFGYRVQGEIGEQDLVTGTLQYQGPYGRYEATYERLSGKNSTTLSASGGIVAIGGSVYPTRAVPDSFALIRVPGVAGVRGYVNNQEVGRTNAQGYLLVPNLLSYQGNRLSIAEEDIPLNYRIDAMEHIIAPPLRGGALARFAVQQTQRLTGTLVVEGRERTVLPTYGQLTVLVDEKPVVSPLGKQGEFYFEDVPTGRYAAEVVYKDGVCRFAFDVPVSDQPFLNLGTLRCVVP